MSRREELVRLGRRGQQVAGLSLLVGALTGLSVALFERLVESTAFERLLAAPLAVQTAVPTLGLAAAALTLRWVTRGASPGTADEYVRNDHDRDERLSLRAVPGRLLASAFTLGSGAPLGFERPSLYMATVSSSE